MKIRARPGEKTQTFKDAGVLVLEGPIQGTAKFIQMTPFLSAAAVAGCGSWLGEVKNDFKWVNEIYLFLHVSG